MSSEEPQTEPAAEAVQTFPIAPMDGRFRVATMGVLLLAVGLVVGLVFGGLAAGGIWRVVLWIAGALAAIGAVVGIVLVRLYSRPVHFELSDEGLRIVWSARSRKLPSNAFSEARLVTETELGNLARCFGVSPLFGAFGWFRSEYMGSMDAYITRSTGLVYLRMANRHPLLLTPQRPNEFLAALRDIADRVD